jgi:hypothetical protein
MSPVITDIPVPPATRINSEVAGSYFHDCYLMPLAHEGQSALEIFLRTVARSPRWVEFLLGLRNRIVAPFGLKNVGHLGSLPPHKPARDYKIGDQVGIFKLLSATDDEVILGETDKHLDVKVSLCKVMRENSEAVTVTTVVHIHNLLGSIYMMIVTPMHRIVAPAVMRRATAAYHHD